MSFRLASVLAPCLALLLASSALADDEPKVSLEIDIGAVWVEAPEVDGLAAAIGDGSGFPFLVTRAIDGEADVEDWGAGFDVLASFPVPGGHLPKWRIEFGGGWSKVEADESDSTILAAGGGVSEFLGIKNVNGLVSLGYLAGPDDVVNTDFDGEVKFWELRLAMARSFDLHEMLGTKARIGLVGGSLDQDYHVDHSVDDTLSGNGTARSFHDLDMEVENLFVGLLFGGDLAVEPIDGLRLAVNTEVAFLYNGADLDVEQEYVGFLFPAPGVFPVLGCSPLCNTKNHERDRDKRLSARPRVEVALDWDLGFVILGLTGSYTYWSYAPQVVNPTAPVGRSAIFTGADPSHISGDDMQAVATGVRLTFPFGRN